MPKTHKITANWLQNMAFETELHGHRLVMDAGTEFGGQDLGPRPKPFMLLALAGCTGMDVVSLLKKMRVDFDSFSIEVEGELSEDSPSRYTKMHVIYIFKGRELPMNKLEKAVKMSEDQLCGVGAVYRKCMEISSEIRILS
ncbi:MAG: OsmC family protein [Bacteroidales bacterium]|jgi:putative redox protein|nr:OsmC family protein [Bacteroidales bacterium]